MSTIPKRWLEPNIEAALGELENRIRARYPKAVFSPFRGFGDGPLMIYLQAVVGVDDTDEVLDLVIDRLVEMRVEEGIPIDVHARRRQRFPTLQIATLSP